ncbi:hypothetical protein [Streptomyces sp. NPDC002769]|uniref:hypothetical protein n=1 Tax=Streptomyces sp. NPDC002769 TaxID=3154542 RepID=UPI00332AB4C7
MAFAEGSSAGIRDADSHEDGLPELPEHELLAQLAAFSVLARWMDTATLLTVRDEHVRAGLCARVGTRGLSVPQGR